MVEILLILVGLVGLAAGALLIINGVGSTAAVLNRKAHEEDMNWGALVEQRLLSIRTTAEVIQEQVQAVHKNTDALLLGSLGLVKGMTAVLDKMAPGQAAAIINGPDLEDAGESTGVEERPL